MYSMKKILSIAAILSFAAVLAVPVLVVGDVVPVEPSNTLPTTNLPDTKAEIEATLNAIVNWVFAIMVVVGVIFVVLAAFQFVTGGGDPAKVAEARQKLIWAVLGFAVAVLARAILPLVKSLLNVS